MVDINIDKCSLQEESLWDEKRLGMLLWPTLYPSN